MIQFHDDGESFEVDISDMDSDFGKIVFGLSYLRASRTLDNRLKFEGTTMLEDAICITMLASKLEHLSPGLVRECLEKGWRDLKDRGLVTKSPFDKEG